MANTEFTLRQIRPVLRLVPSPAQDRDTSDLWAGKIPIEGLSPKLATLFRYWRARFHGERPPSRADIDPIEIARIQPDLLPHLWLMDVQRNPLRFRCRLVGGAVIEAGSPFRAGDMLGPDDGSLDWTSRSLFRNLVTLCENRSWNYRCGTPTLPHARHVNVVERLSLPLCDETGEVAQIFSATLYSWQDGWGTTSLGH